MVDADVQITDMAQFIEAIDGLDFDDYLLMRGQRQGGWPLTPSLARLKLEKNKTLLETEQTLLREFKSACLPYLDVQGKDEFDILSIAQHHGLATRLLDWTGNPLAALWFAVKDPANSRIPGVVTAFIPNDTDFVDRAKGLDPFGLRKTQFFKPSHLNSRIVAQNGWFSVHKWNTKVERFSRLDTLSAYAKRIHRFEIPAESFWLLRRQLDRMGINNATMFPDLDGITKNLNWSYSLFSDETDS